MTEDKVVFHRIAADVEVAVLHTQFVAAIGLVFNGERRHLGGVEHVQFVHLNFNIASRDVLVFAITFYYLARYLNHPFTAQLFSTFAQFGAFFVIES